VHEIKLDGFRMAARIDKGRVQLLTRTGLVDGLVEERKGTVSVFNGPEPKIVIAQDEAAEKDAVATFIKEALAGGVAPREIGAPETLNRARAVVHSAGAEAIELSDRTDDPGERVSIGTMHLAKGLEFKAVAVMACDEDALPLRSRIDAAADEAELEDVYDTERQSLYVAATRAARSGPHGSAQRQAEWPANSMSWKLSEVNQEISHKVWCP
jgi:superfamily I DNA/RNA helicase